MTGIEFDCGTIFNCDCFDFLSKVQDKSVDLVLIDLPYGVSRETGFKNGGQAKFDRIKISLQFGDWDKRLDLGRLLPELYRVLRIGGTCIAFYDLWKIQELHDEMEATKFRMLRPIFWEKSNPVPLNQRRTYLSGAHELAVCGVRGGSPTFHGKYHHGVYRHPVCHDSGRFHPTQKPICLIEELIEMHSNPGDMVIDCVMGSGTTAKAAKNTARRFMGCEIDSQYFSGICRRLKT